MEDVPPLSCHIIFGEHLFTNHGLYPVLDVHAKDIIKICPNELLQDQ